MKTTVVYFHGYGSSSKTDKVVGLAQNFDSVAAPDIPIDFDDASVYLTNWINDLKSDGRSLLFVGTSLGGYWASRMSAQFKIPAVIINPSCTPSSTLSRYGVDATVISKYPNLVVSSDVPRIVLLAQDDDMLDYNFAAKLFANKAHVKLFKSGGHCFQDINTISSNIVELLGCSFYLP